MKPLSTYAAFLFDMDGTLVETERTWAIALSQLLADDGLTLSPKEAYTLICGRSWNSIYRDVLTRFPSQAAYSSDQQAARLQPYYLRAREGTNQTIPGSAETFRDVAAFGPCAIVSGSRREDIDDTLRTLHIADVCTLTIGAQDCPNGKPAPDGFLMAARALHVDPAHCVVFEDSVAGVQSGKAAGMTVVALIPPGAEPHPEIARLADLCVHSLLEVPR